jgi:predicted transcriptional regulator
MSESTERDAIERTPEDDPDRIERRAEMARALAIGGMDGVHVLSHESAERVLTEKRRQLVEVLDRRRVESVRDLARRVERDKGQVSRDLGILAEHGVVDFEETSREKRPYLQNDHLVVEPIH